MLEDLWCRNVHFMTMIVWLLFIFHLLKATANTQSPNIVFILADDLGYNDIGYHAIHGMSAVKTPHLDALANEGVKLENYYVQPICSPSRSILMTGRYLIRYGLQHHVFLASQPTCLPLSETTLAETLRELGYSTHAIGKWHLGFCRTECLPTRRGFDSFFGSLVGTGTDHYSHNQSHGVQVNSEYIPGASFVLRMDGNDLRNNEEPVYTHEGEYSAELLTKKAQSVIRDHKREEPLFLYLAYQVAHSPLQAPSKYTDLYDIKDQDRRRYLAMVSALDEGVQNVTDTLKEAGMWQNTVLVFSTDNGAPLNFGGNSWPLRGGKWSYWEGGVRAVGFVNSPLLSDSVKGTVNSELMHISDWFPTFVDGIAKGDTSLMNNPLDGINQWDVISAGKLSSRTEVLLNIDHLTQTAWTDPLEKLYWKLRLMDLDVDGSMLQLLTTTGAIISGRWKLLTGKHRHGTWQTPPESNIREEERIAINRVTSLLDCSSPNTMLQLFDLWNDPMEICNVVYKPENKQLVIDLLMKLQKYNNESAPVFYPRADINSDPSLHGDAWSPWLDHDTETLLKLYRV